MPADKSKEKTKNKEERSFKKECIQSKINLLILCLKTIKAKLSTKTL